MKDESLI